MIEMIKRALKKRNLIEKILCYFLIKIGFSNLSVQALQIRNKEFKRMTKKYGRSVHVILKNPLEKTTVRTIWICWFQGIENAPELVKKCVKSVCENSIGWNIVLLNKDNMMNYVDIPDYIVKKWNEGKIGNAHMSDILRTELLIKYGGLWVDATVYLSGPLPGYIDRNGFFMYRHSVPDDITIQFNNWLIYSRPQNEVLVNIRDFLYEYWKKNNSVREYFMWHLFLTMIVNKNPNIFCKIPYVTDELTQTLSRILFYPYDACFWRELSAMTPVHKLSYKKQVEDIDEDTYYAKLMGGGV